MAELEQFDKNMKSEEVKSDIIYHNPKEESEFKIEGLAWFDKHHDYFRLPIECKENVTEAVYWLASHPAGGQIRFKTNSKNITVKIKNKGHYEMCHMAATGQQGVDLYYRVEGKKEFTFFTCAKFSAPTSEFESPLFKSDEQIEKDIIINLPLYEGLEEILIGLDDDATLLPPSTHKASGKVVVYGTSITQGGCASRPGMALTNILGRKLDIEFVNLGFSGSGLGEPAMAKIINEIDDVAMIVLDYDGNGGCTGDLEKHMEEFVDILREKFVTTPILVISKIPYSNYVFIKDEIELRKRTLAFQRKFVANKRMKKGDMNIYFYDGNNIFGDEDASEMMVDGIHPTDLGFYMMSKTLLPIFKRLLHISSLVSVEEAKEIEKERKLKEEQLEADRKAALED